MGIVVPTTPTPFTTPSTAPTTVPTTVPTNAPTTVRTTIHTDSTTFPTTSPRTPSTSTKFTTPSIKTTPNVSCQGNGLFPDPNNCQVFYQCVLNIGGNWLIYKNECDLGTVFNPAIDICDWPRNVPGCENSLH